MGRNREHVYQSKILELAAARGHYCVKFNANGLTKSGVPDIIMCVNGYFLAIEVKTADGEATPLQLYNINAIKKSGGVAIVSHEGHMDEIIQILNRLERL